MLGVVAVAICCLGGIALFGEVTGRRQSARVWAILGMIGLAVSWYALFVWVAALTEGLLLPWDLAADRSSLGTWSRTINDFFEGTPGSLLPAAATVGCSAAIFALRLLKNTDRHLLPWVLS